MTFLIFEIRAALYDIERSTESLMAVRTAIARPGPTAAHTVILNLGFPRPQSFFVHRTVYSVYLVSNTCLLLMTISSRLSLVTYRHTKQRDSCPICHVRFDALLLSLSLSLSIYAVQELVFELRNMIYAVELLILTAEPRRGHDAARFGIITHWRMHIGDDLRVSCEKLLLI